MVRYQFEFSDLSGDLFTGELSNENYEGQTITLQGSASVSKDLSDNIAQPIQAKAVNVNLLATIEQPLEDIYNEDDRYWLFTLKQNGSSIFQGYVSTEDMEQSYTSKGWYLNFDCLDHLSYLEDFGYYDSAGLPYSGNDTVLNIIRKCIDRGFNGNDNRLNFITSHFLEFNSGDVFANTYLDQGQFYDDEGEAEDCSKILEDILKSMGCFIVQFRLNYVIIAVSNFVKIRSELVPYNLYNDQGTYLATLNFAPNDSTDIIGANINGYPTYFANANQSLVRKKFYNTFRVRHDLEFRDQVLENGDMLETTGTTPPWTLGPNTTVLPSSVEIQAVELPTSITVEVTSEWIDIAAGDRVEIELDFEFSSEPSAPLNIVQRVDILYQDVNQVQLSRRPLFVYPETQFVTYTDIDPKFTEYAEDGRIRVEIYSAWFGDDYSVSDYSRVLSVNLKNAVNEVEANEYTYRRTDKTTGSVEDTYEVRFNTNPSILLKNNFFDSTGSAIATLSKGAEEVVLANEIGLMFLNLFSQNHIRFSGDVANNFDFSPKELKELGTHFVITRENKDLKTNISSLELTQVQDSELLESQYENETTRIFRESVKPVIE